MKKPVRRKAKKGFFLTFEGGEGGGKTTQIAKLQQELQKRGKHVVVTREPGGSAIANRIRAMILDPQMKGLVSLAELFLYEASRAQHVADTILPALESGAVVICDRFADSSVVYQGAARGIDGKLVKHLNGIATGGLQPDRTLVLDLDPRVGLARAGKRGTLDRMEAEKIEFHEAVRVGYQKLARAERKRIRLIDANRSVEEIHRHILQALKDFLK